jgi:hypothetical protein
MFLAADGLSVTAVIVRTLTGAGSTGQVFAEPVEVEGFLSDRLAVVRTKSGAEVVSDSSYFTDPDKADLFAPDSEVDLPDRTALVIRAARNVIGDPDVDHCRVWLT